MSPLPPPSRCTYFGNHRFHRFPVVTRYEEFHKEICEICGICGSNGSWYNRYLDMRFALAQLNYTVGAFEANYERVAIAAARARKAGADLLVLSELATTGYPPRDLLNHSGFIDANLALRDRIAALSDWQLGVLLGCV